MMFLKPDGRIDLEHRSSFLRGAPHRSIVVAAAEDGRFSIVNTDLNDARSHRHSARIRAVSPHPLDRRLALVDRDSGSLAIQSHDGQRLLEIVPPQVHEDIPNRLKQGFEDCHFDATGECLWLAAPLNAEECEIQLIQIKTGSLLGKVTVKDPFGGSCCSFHTTERPDLVSLWLAAGQDGQQVYWLTRDGNGFYCTLEPRLTNTMPPVFSPSGERFLVVTENHTICQFSLFDMQHIGLPLDSGYEDNPFVESLCFLTDRQALASTNEQRIFVVDTIQMKVETEVSLEGHEPRPIGEYYPRLAKEEGLGTDISYFMRLGNVIIFVYRRDRSTGLEGWVDTLLWLRVKS